MCSQVMRGLLDNRLPNNDFYREGQSAAHSRFTGNFLSANFFYLVTFYLLVNLLTCECVCVSVFMEIVGEKSRHSLQENLHLIRVPLQVIWGKEDQVGCLCGRMSTKVQHCDHKVSSTRVGV